MASATQFIGSKISLISKSEIRYEGILYSLDLMEATISLAKVKSFGTEDRPTERPVQARDEIYEFIIFRGTDIKGIDVVEPPTAPNNSFNDPAIVEVSQYQPPPVAPPAPLIPNIPFKGPELLPHKSNEIEKEKIKVAPVAIGSGIGNDNIPQQGLPNPIAPQVVPIENQQQHWRAASNTTRPENRRGGSTQQYNNTHGTHGTHHHNNAPSANPQHNNTHAIPQQQHNNAHGPQHHNNTHATQYHNNAHAAQHQHYNNTHTPQQIYRGGYNIRARGYNRGGRGKPQQPKMVFKEPYDFEKANEELCTLSKIKLEDDDKVEEPKEVVDEIFYQKDNFFDNISCEALEAGKGRRPDWRAERKLNAETFGVSLQRGGGGYQRRGYGYNSRGYGGRGYSYGSYGGYNRGYQRGGGRGGSF